MPEPTIYPRADRLYTNDARLDSVSGANRVISVGLSSVYNGEMYTTAYAIDELASQASVAFNIEVPADREVYIRELTVWSEAALSLYELGGGHTITGGTVVPAWNRNRKYTDSSTVVIKRDVTIVGGGVIKEVYFGGGNKGAAGTFGEGGEYVFAPGSRAFIRLTNKTNTTATMSLLITYGEMPI